MPNSGKNTTVNANDHIVSYLDEGPRGEEVIIFVHGFPFDKSSWRPQMEFMQKTHRAITYDIRGFGQSSSGNEKGSISLFAEDLVKFMDALLINKAIVCGLSMGGYVLLNAISRFPERFSAVILSDTQCIADSPEAKEKRNRTITQIIAGGLGDFADGFVNNIFCPATFELKKELPNTIRKIILSTATATITGTLSALAQRQETCSTLNKIAVPALILCGKEDKVTPPAQAEYLRDHIANAQLFIIENAAHLSNLEQPDEFNRHLGGFISSRII